MSVRINEKNDTLLVPLLVFSSLMDYFTFSTFLLRPLSRPKYSAQYFLSSFHQSTFYPQVERETQFDTHMKQDNFATFILMLSKCLSKRLNPRRPQQINATGNCIKRNCVIMQAVCHCQNGDIQESTTSSKCEQDGGNKKCVLTPSLKTPT